MPAQNGAPSPSLPCWHLDYSKQIASPQNLPGLLSKGVYLPGEGGPCIAMLTAKEGNFCRGQSRGRDRQQAREMGVGLGLD